MTLRDFESWVVKGQTFPEDFCNYEPTVWSRTMKFATITLVVLGEKRVSKVSDTPLS